MLPSIVCEKNVDIISITDHNSAKNVAAFFNLCGNKIVVPGIEIHTVEDVHILGYFSTIEDCLKVSKFIEEYITPFSYDPESFGYQIVINEKEEIVDTIDYYLGFPTNLTIEEAIDIILKNKGLPVFAHIDRKFGVLYQLGLLPQGTKVVEVRKKETYLFFKERGYIILTSSDAHHPDEIGSRKSYFTSVGDASDVLKAIIAGEVKTIWDL
ncbi:MAG: PHP-associated domain-containing protein [Fervidobacterium sp.]